MMSSSFQILLQVNGDVDAAIEFLIAEQETEECSATSDPSPSQTDSCGKDQSVNFAFFCFVIMLRGSELVCFLLLMFWCSSVISVYFIAI